MPVDDTGPITSETDEIQDNSRERQMRSLFGLSHSGENRGGLDAVDAAGHAFELKSGTTNSITTARDVGLHTIAKWRTRHFLVCTGTKPRGGEFRFERCLAASPEQMEWWLGDLENRLSKSKDLIDRVMGILRRAGLLSDEELARIEGILGRGYTLNNPKINFNKMIENGATVFDMTRDLPKQLQSFVANHPLPTSDPTDAGPQSPQSPALPV